MRISEIEDNDEVMRTFLKYFVSKYPNKVTISNGVITAKTPVHKSIPEKFEKLPVSFLKIVGDFTVAEAGLTTLIGFPKIVTGYINIVNNNLTSLDYGPIQCRYLYVGGNPLVSLDGLPQRCEYIELSYNKNLNLLKLFMVKGLQEVDLRDSNNSRLSLSLPLSNILTDKTKNLNTQQKILTAKRWLINNGYESNAKL